MRVFMWRRWVSRDFRGNGPGRVGDEGSSGIGSLVAGLLSRCVHDMSIRHKLWNHSSLGQSTGSTLPIAQRVRITDSLSALGATVLTAGIVGWSAGAGWPKSPRLAGRLLPPDHRPIPGRRSTTETTEAMLPVNAVGLDRVDIRTSRPPSEPGGFLLPSLARDASTLLLARQRRVSRACRPGIGQGRAHGGAKVRSRRTSTEVAT
jgi:hypothetical protein